MGIQDTDTVSITQYEELRLIIQKEQGREVALTEAIEYGKSLVNAYRLLAGDREILGVKRQDETSDSNFSTEVDKTQKSYVWE